MCSSKPTPLSAASERVARGYTRRFVRSLPPHLDPQDFLSVALIAAWRAENSFDPTKGATLFSWVRGQVWHALIEQLRREDHLTRTQRQGRNDDELPDQYRQPLWIDMPVGDEGLSTLADILPQPPLADGDGYTPSLRATEVQAWFRYLRPELQCLLRRIFWEEETQKQIARAQGRSESRIQQLRQEAVQQLRKVAQP